MLFGLTVIAAAAAVMAIDFPGFWKRKEWKELTVSLLFLLIGITLGIAQARHLPVPNPLEWIIKIHLPIRHLLEMIYGKF
ncbi:hypothetical protein SAMN04487970_101986 [Paenibacillus tianmuensis]|uniref:Uncharacterized protein n=1 Tax=Paenibacillus tianmuensis TaxID=624147 RepID=A0A1G4RUS8_9BACL|nr:hypothetical protein [Paenibacillus tianmuensis]SCW60624.1 hypothetical protein SAMN04487970_101986 [Paenibacillus tianmuensis]